MRFAEKRKKEGHSVKLLARMNAHKETDLLVQGVTFVKQDVLSAVVKKLMRDWCNGNM